MRRSSWASAGEPPLTDRCDRPSPTSWNELEDTGQTNLIFSGETSGIQGSHSITIERVRLPVFDVLEHSRSELGPENFGLSGHTARRVVTTTTFTARKCIQQLQTLASILIFLDSCEFVGLTSPVGDRPVRVTTDDAAPGGGECCARFLRRKSLYPLLYQTTFVIPDLRLQLLSFPTRLALANIILVVSAPCRLNSCCANHKFSSLVVLIQACFLFCATSSNAGTRNSDLQLRDRAKEDC